MRTTTAALTCAAIAAAAVLEAVAQVQVTVASVATAGADPVRDCHTSIIAGSVGIEVAGSTDNAYIAQAGGTKLGGVSTQGDSVTLTHDMRAYVADQCDSAFEPAVFKQIPLLGRTISFTTDLSNIGCGCNAAFYLVNMPATTGPTKCGDYYCDANDVCGVGCTEMDLMEANNKAMQVTPHKCDGSSCDGSGCGKNTKNMGNAFGPGGQYTIDTTQAFTVNTTFHGDSSGDILKKVETVIFQNGKTVTITHDDSSCPSGYVEAMSEPIKNGMVIVASYWGDKGSTMSWMDVPPCDPNVACNGGSPLTFSNIIVE